MPDNVLKLFKKYYLIFPWNNPMRWVLFMLLPSVSVGDWFWDPPHIKIHGHSSLLYKRVYLLPITSAHPPIYFSSSLDYLQYLTHYKCSVNSCWHVANSSFAFWNFMEFFFFLQTFFIWICGCRTYRYEKLTICPFVIGGKTETQRD